MKRVKTLLFSMFLVILLLVITASAAVALDETAETEGMIPMPSFPVVTSPPVITLPPIYLLDFWTEISTSSGAGHFTEAGGLDVSTMNLLAVGNLNSMDYEIHYFNGDAWTKKDVPFRPSALEWAGMPSSKLYATDNQGNSVWVCSNPTEKYPDWYQIASHGSGTGEFDNPKGMYAASSGTLYVIDTGNDRIQYRLSNGTWGVSASPSDAGTLVDIVISGGTKYVTDFSNNCIYYQTQFSKGWSKLEDPSYINYPTYIDADSAGNLYFVSWCIYGSDYKRSIVKYDGSDFTLYVSAGEGEGKISTLLSFSEEIDINSHDMMFYSDNGGPSVYKRKCDINNLGAVAINGDYPMLMEGQIIINWSVPSETVDASIVGTAECPYASVGGNGNYPLDFGLNTFYLTVTPETGLSKIHTLNVTRELSDNALLDSMTIELVPVDGFSPGIFAYSGISVGYETESVKINAVPQDENATVEGTGTVELAVGENLALIDVTAQDGVTTQQYMLVITREGPPAEPSPSPSPSVTPSPGPTPTPTGGPTPTPTPTMGPTPGPSPTATPASTPTPTPAGTEAPTQTPDTSPASTPASGTTPEPAQTPASGEQPTPTPGAAPADASPSPSQTQPPATETLQPLPTEIQEELDKQKDMMNLLYGGLLVLGGGAMGITGAVLINKTLKKKRWQKKDKEPKD